MSIRSYLTTLLLVCAVSAIATAVAADGKSKKYVRFLLSCLVLLVLLSPLVTLGEQGVDLTSWGQDAGAVPDADQTLLLRATAQALKDSLCAELSLDAEEVLVGIDGEVGTNGEVQLSRITVTLSGDSTARREAVRTYLRDGLNCDCEVRVYVGTT